MKRIIALIAAIMMVIVVTGCSVAKDDANHQGLHYKAGPLSATKFANCISPSTRNYDGPADKHYYYPAGQRTFSFTGTGSYEEKPIQVTDASGQSMYVPGYVTLTLTNNCKLLQQFHEKLGLKYNAYTTKGNGGTPSGWDDLLIQYVGTPLQQAMNDAAQNTPGGWKALYTNTGAQDSFEAQVKAVLPGKVASAMGGNYFNIDSVTISKPEIPTGLQAAIENKQEAIQANAAQKAQNAKILTQYDTIKSCLKTGLSESDCTLIFLSQSGANIPFLPVPQGGNINYAPSAPTK